MVISDSYFKGSILIESVALSIPNGAVIGNGNSLRNYVLEYESDILIKCLGYSLYKDFSEQFDVNELKASVDQKWKDLLNGKEYELNGVRKFWRGLRFEENELQKSLIAYYVFSVYIKKENSGLGIQKEKIKDVTVSPSYLYMSAYNTFVELTTESKSGLQCLYDFITDMNSINSETYPNWMPTSFKKINPFSI